MAHAHPTRVVLPTLCHVGGGQRDRYKGVIRRLSRWLPESADESAGLSARPSAA